ncbi:hypothetical protein [Actinomadura formosensis]|uniref:hypothetical protein n=1 Tax=Actinomadura formosensis TaxID=60706 RepID=UPI0008356AEC|nr:hypothetical protein [Actinomadura formosensis]
MSETFADLVACEDVLMFVNAAITSTGQREFHHDAGEQRLSLDFLHEYMLENYREVYAAALALDVNDHNAAIIVRNLLVRAGEVGVERRRREGLLIARRLETLPPQRVYRLFRELRRLGVNNRRTRAVIRDWMAARRDPAFDFVKYRGAVKDVVRHAHLRLGDEQHDFLFTPHRVKSFRTPIFEQWRRAHYEQAAIYELPYTVAEGFAAKHGIAREVFLERIEPKMTRLERLRLHKSADVQVDLGEMPLTRLASYVLSLPLDERAERRAELSRALRTAARRVAGAARGSWGRVTAVLDDSYSSLGSGQKRRRPLAVALAAHYLLEALAREFTPLWTSGRTDELLLYPSGPTPLGLRIIDALGTGPERLLIVSDGWDNAPPGLAADVLRVWRTRLDPGHRLAPGHRVLIVHLNPVYEAGDFDVRRLAPGVPTAGVRDAENLPTLVELARFAEGRVGLDKLQAHLDDRAARFLGVPA